jgi:hypothetical protein
MAKPKDPTPASAPPPAPAPAPTPDPVAAVVAEVMPAVVASIEAADPGAAPVVTLLETPAAVTVEKAILGWVEHEIERVDEAGVHYFEKFHRHPPAN